MRYCFGGHSHRFVQFRLQGCTVSLSLSSLPSRRIHHGNHHQCYHPLIPVEMPFQCFVACPPPCTCCSGSETVGMDPKLLELNRNFWIGSGIVGMDPKLLDWIRKGRGVRLGFRGSLAVDGTMDRRRTSWRTAGAANRGAWE